MEATISNATSYVWFFNGVQIPGANQQTLTVSQPGNYSVIVNKPGCVENATADVDIFLPSPPNGIGSPTNLQACGPEPAIFNLLDNDPNIFNGLFGFISY
ncbi:hypothetical protein V6O07_08560, partial [Arthrospira platensis SPKY2]